MRLIDATDRFLRRCWLSWRFMRGMRYPPRVAWAKAWRAS
jgi:hypothetical protein